MFRISNQCKQIHGEDTQIPVACSVPQEIPRLPWNAMMQYLQESIKIECWEPTSGLVANTPTSHIRVARWNLCFQYLASAFYQCRLWKEGRNGSSR